MPRALDIDALTGWGINCATLISNGAVPRGAMARSPLHEMFNPRSVAVIGASRTPGKIGNTLVKNIVTQGYGGKVYPINPEASEVWGRKAYPRIQDVPGEVDLAVVAVPAQLVREEVENCGRKGVKFVVVVSSGFKEIGNRKGENDIVIAAKKYGVRLLGPNVVGFYSGSSSLNCTFGPVEMPKGSLAIVTQSGALGIALMGKMAEERIGLSGIVSLGNKSDLSEVEMLRHFGQDPGTKVILLYLEGTRLGRELMEVAREVVPHKPIVAIKAGSSQKGARAAASHTGSLAGSDAIFDAAFHQCGLLRAVDIDEALCWVRMLGTQPLPRGERTLIVTNAGGLGVMATDACERSDVTLLDDQPYLDKLFAKEIPSYGSTKNPVDITGQARDADYERVLRIGLEDKGVVHALLALYTETADGDPVALARAMMRAVEGSRAGKPVAFGLIGGPKVNAAIDLLNDAGYPAYFNPNEAVSALGALYRRWRFLNKPIEPMPVFDLELSKIREVVRKARAEGRLQLSAAEVSAVVAALGLRQPRMAVRRTVEECVAVADDIGYPVVMKVVSKDIVHKTEAGGVKLDIDDAREVATAYEAILTSCRQRYPDASIEGILVSEMVTGGVETIVGGSTDPSFGEVVMFGMGGIYVEVLRDVSFRVAPIPEGEARAMVRGIRSSPIFYGARGEPPKDVESVATALYRIGRLMGAVPEIMEMDLNPLVMLDRGKGCVVLDARVTLKEAGGEVA
jgi:acetyl coenzyme A synthetase (ADP forming)-like protein